MHLGFGDMVPFKGLIPEFDFPHFIDNSIYLILDAQSTS